MTTPVLSKTPVLDPSWKSDTVDHLIGSATFLKNSQAVKKGGQASLANVEKDVDTLLKTSGAGVSQKDLTNDLIATGLSESAAATEASRLKAAASSGNKTEVQNHLADLFAVQGGLSASYAQGLANKLVSLAGTSADTVDYQTAAQKNSADEESAANAEAAAKAKAEAAAEMANGVVTPPETQRLGKLQMLEHCRQWFLRTSASKCHAGLVPTCVGRVRADP